MGITDNLWQLLAIKPFVDVLFKLELMDWLDSRELIQNLESKYGCRLQ